MSRTYLRIVSWHVVRRVDASGWVTYCGRVINEEGEAAHELPLDEKSCETCLRLAEGDSAAAVLEAADNPEDDEIVVHRGPADTENVVQG